jgi:hypothetical protein
MNLPLNVQRSFTGFGDFYAKYGHFDKDDEIAKTFDYVMYAGFVKYGSQVDGTKLRYDQILEQEIMLEFSLVYEHDEGQKNNKRGFIRAMVNKIKSDMDGGLNLRRSNNQKGVDRVNVIRRKNDNGQAVTMEEKKMAAKRKPMSNMAFDENCVKTSRPTTTGVVSGEREINTKKQRIAAIDRQIKEKENERERLEAEIIQDEMAMTARRMEDEPVNLEELTTTATRIEEEAGLMTTTVPQQSEDIMVDSEEEVRQFVAPPCVFYTSDSTHDLQTLYAGATFYCRQLLPMSRAL